MWRNMRENHHGGISGMAWRMGMSRGSNHQPASMAKTRNISEK